MKIRINLGSIWSTIAPVVVPLAVSAISGALQKKGDRIVQKAQRPAATIESTAGG